MKVNVDKPSSCQRVLSIEVPSETVDAEIENIYEKVKRDATHPGFRKGKVPRKILERKLGDSIRAEAIETTVSTSLRQALEEQELIPLTDPEFGEVKFDDEGPLSFDVTIEVEPAVELPEYKGIELKRPKAEVQDDDVQKVLERLQISNAKYIPADRPVQENDFIIMDFESFEDGKHLEGGKAENFPLEVGSGAFGEEFESQIIGMSKDEQKRIVVNYPEDYKAKDLAGKKIDFDVTVKDIKLRELPDLDDDFAKDLGTYETLDKMKEQIRENLQQNLEKRMEHFLREQAISKITAETNVEMPPKLKAKVAASIFDEEVNRLIQNGASRDAVTAEKDKIIENAETQAERQLKLTFVTDEIAKREDISITEEELKEKIDETVKELEERDPRARSYFDSDRVRDRYRDQLRMTKILDFVVSNAKVEDVDMTEEELEPEEAGGETATDEKEGDS